VLKDLNNERGRSQDVQPVDAVIEVRQLAKVYGKAAKVEALRGLDLTLTAGEFVAVMGASGSGKSTLLHLLAGLDEPTSGSICLAGVDLARLSEDERAMMRRDRLGLIFQAFHLLGTLTAEENVLLPLSIAGTSAAVARRRADEAMACVGLTHRRHHFPEQLSGGEQQRVAIARALVIDPVILLADEPTGNLDSVQANRIMDLLRELVDQRRQTMLLVTHDAGYASRADRILWLRDGKLIADTAPIQRPRLPKDAALAEWSHTQPEEGQRRSVLLVPESPDLPPVFLISPGENHPVPSKGIRRRAA
jgi:putative ABC transport system ATP-binding protein